MIPRIATVLSVREWEANLVAAVRDSALARLVLRAYQPAEIDERRDEIDVLVVGAETSWVTQAAITAWKRRGLAVVGIHPVGDSPARRILLKGGADEILEESTAPETVVAAARAVCGDRPTSVDDGTGLLVVVTGSRGAPGRTETALGLAWNMVDNLDTLVLDADVEAPSLAVRLGLPARPDLQDAADSVRLTATLGPTATRDGIHFIVGSHRPGEPPVRQALIDEVIDMAIQRFDLVIADTGPQLEDASLLKRADVALLVVGADPVGIVRAARVCDEWAGPPPAVVLNRVHRGESGQAISAARKWLGLDPLAVIQEDVRVVARARAGAAPARSLLRSLRRLEMER